jgi:hypothetical protein
MNVRNRYRRGPRGQGGVVLFVALIAMLLLSLAGIALVRSVDTSLGVAGNIGFRHASIGPVNQGIEQAINDVFKSGALTSTTADDPAHAYFAMVQPGESRYGVPAVLQGDYSTMSSAYSSAVTVSPWQDPISGAEMRYVVERLCNSPAAGTDISYKCDILPPKVPSAGTDNKCSVPPCLTLPPIPLFRVTVRVDVLRTNSVTFAQGTVK